MRFAVMATDAITGDPRRIMIEGGHGKTGIARAVTDHTIRATGCRHGYMRQ